MAWVCMAASEIISLEFIDNFTANSSSRMTVEICSNIQSAQIQMSASEPIEQYFVCTTMILNIQPQQQRRFCRARTV